MFEERDENAKPRPSWKGLTEQPSFDELARGVASGAISRSQAIKLIGAAILGAALVPLLPGMTEAAPTTPKCPKKAGCTAFCKNSDRQCVCIRTVEGEKVCVVPECGEPETPCTSSALCGEDQVCAQTTTQCCDGGRPICVQKCVGPIPRTAR